MLTLFYGGIVGLSLGLTGGGGSIFAVPLLVYGLGLDVRRAVTLSLAVVGITALYGAVLQARRAQVLWGAGAVLGLGGILAAPLGTWLGAMLPPTVTLRMFAALMVVIGIRMLGRREAADDAPRSWISCQRQANGIPRFTPFCAAKLLGAGAATGVLSGVFGVGGGFLVVPALLVVACVSIERALATSLVGIALTAAAGFAAHVHQLSLGDGRLAVLFLAGSATGMTLGAFLKTHVPARRLQSFFGISVLGTAVYVILRTL